MPWQPLAMRHLAAVLLALTFAACGESILTPATGPGTEYPCGVGHTVCTDGMCCGVGDVCGGSFPNVGCPAGACCYEGLDAVSRDAGLRQLVVRGAQTPAR